MTEYLLHALFRVVVGIGSLTRNGRLSVCRNSLLDEQADRILAIPYRLGDLGLCAALFAASETMPEQEYGKGKPGPGRGHKTADIISRFPYGTDPAYLAARIKRDAPDIAEAAEGEENG